MKYPRFGLIYTVKPGGMMYVRKTLFFDFAYPHYIRRLCFTIPCIIIDQNGRRIEPTTTEVSTPSLNTTMAFGEYQLHCPHCNSTDFHRRQGFHPLTRFWCHKCNSTFFRARRVDTYSYAAKRQERETTHAGFNTKRLIIALGVVIAIVGIITAIKTNPLGTLLIAAAVFTIIYLSSKTPQQKRRRRRQRLARQRR